MTCVVGLETKQGVWLGTDSFLGTEGGRSLHDRPKWFRKGPLVFAWAGDARAAQVVEYALTLPSAAVRKKSPDPLPYLVAVASRLRLDLREAGANLRAPGSADGAGTTFLVAYEKRLYYLQEDYSVVRPREGFAAVGAGEPYGLAALAALHPLLGPREAVLGALQVAGRLSNHVAPPYHVEMFP